MRRLPVAAFIALAIATVGAFFVTQHLKVSTPLLTGRPAPEPAAFNPVSGQVCLVHLRNGTIKRVDHRKTFVSFYLLNRSDNVDVYIVNSEQEIVRTLASGVYMRASPPVRRTFTWNGRLDDGSIAPDGTYYIRVTLIHQARYVLISNNAGPEPITVETVPPRPRVTSVTPSLIPQSGGGAGAAIRYSGNRGLRGRILVYRTDVPGKPQLVKSFDSNRIGSAVWDGTITGGAPAPQGTYLIGLSVTDRACNTGVFPPELPPLAGTTPHAGVTVRYLAAQPPLVPVAAGSATTVYVDARRHRYHWTLSRPGVRKPLSSGQTSDYQLSVTPPSTGGPGIDELSLRWGDHRTVVPIVVGSSSRSGSGARVLVVLPTLTWQGYDPVDDDGDGLPNTLAAGDSIVLDRPYADGLPAGVADEAALLIFLHHAGLSFDLTTDVALLRGSASTIASHAAVVLAGTERWITIALANQLRSRVAAGGNLLSLGIGSLLRAVSVSGQRASRPRPPQATDFLDARPGPLASTRGSLILAGLDRLRIFTDTSGALRGYHSYQPWAISAPLRVASAAGVSSNQPAIIGYHVGHGTVIDIGLPGFALSLAHNFDARQLLSRIWHVISR